MMSCDASSRCEIFRFAVSSSFFTVLLQAIPALGVQIDIHGPAGSGAFGSAVAVLPDGKIVVADPNAESKTGAVYLYSPAGVLINSFTGASPDDQVGSGGITILKNGNFVVSSPNWANGAAAAAGAITWVNGSTGLSGTVSATNSLVGSTAHDAVGLASPEQVQLQRPSVTALSNGNYVVSSNYWANAAAANAGAVTWVDGSTGLSGAVSAANSLIGTKSGDRVGSAGVIALGNGNYAIASPSWANGAATAAGAVTWANGTTGLSGALSITNSLVGTQSGDQVGGGHHNGTTLPPDNFIYDGGVTALSDGNYVVVSPHWANGAVTQAGAVTWANGTSKLSGTVSTTNSLVGTTTGDSVGVNGVTALSNGNYVVGSAGWANGDAANAGAATWANGSTGISGAVSAANSLVGAIAGDYIGYSGVTALSNGNYVVDSSLWNNGISSSAFGAVTWVDGGRGLSGAVSTANSLVGTTAGDMVGSGGVTALSNGNYVVGSYNWSNGAATSAGAATWADGRTGISGAVSAANSLVGAIAGDYIGYSGVTALSNGNYVVDSFGWSNGAAAQAGAVTWVDGSRGFTGVVSASNSLVGTTQGDWVGLHVDALDNGNYVVESAEWNNGAIPYAGAVTWANGSTGLVAAVSASNSLIGTTANEQVGSGTFYGGVTPLGNGDYVVYSPFWAHGAIAAAGAVSLGNGTSGGLIGPILAANSVLGATAYGGNEMVSAYDALRDQLVVGQPAANTVSLFLKQTSPPISIGGYMSGNWFNPEQGGHGFQIEAATNNNMVAIWFVYAPDGSSQNWIYAQGAYDKASGAVTLPAILLTGARFPPNFVSSDLTQTAWGTLSFTFTDCNNGTATWSSPLPEYGVGSLPISRLTQIDGTTCPP